MEDKNKSNGPERQGQRKCPQCGAELPAGVPPEFCPKCLLGRAMSGDTQPMNEAGSARHAPALIQSGQTIGRYKIIREVGGGGMGTVFEAVDSENGRRVALKVLSHKLDSPEARERFFREGRLAASINHPNSVYIFGTEEIGGTPVITMELVPGGTLQDRVRTRGPMSPGEAVDAVLQIVDGLEAAHRVGILHRDVKPSNCFIDPDGVVKIGDFGLSISTAVRTEPALTEDGAFLGTPAFCPPEQLRGEELNLRSDIYSLGATLYYLLTGRTPYEAPNVVALIATVLEKPTPSPSGVRPGIPDGLSKIVQRCLHKHRSERFGSYEELRGALQPFSSAAPIAAPLFTRFAAGFLDVLVINALLQSTIILIFGGVVPLLEQIATPGMKEWRFFAISLGAATLYYAIAEGFFGATIGKAVFRLRVARWNRNLPGFGRALIRALIWVWLPMLAFWGAATLAGGAYRKGPHLTAFWPGDNPFSFYLLSFIPYCVMALLFVTARKNNGRLAVHDFLSRTRVIVRHATLRRNVPAYSKPQAALAQGNPCVGPYRVLEEIGPSPDGKWLLAYDLRLLRKVWIRQASPGAQQVPEPLRNIGRPGRLRWLTGRRTAEESWDAFEAPDGQPFLAMLGSPQSWEQVRFWIMDLAGELAASRKDHTEPSALGLDRVWITGEGRAKLLDFTAPGLPSADLPAAPPFAPGEAGPFLCSFATAALSGQPKPEPGIIRARLPGYARRFVQELARITDPEAILSGINSLLRRPATVTQFRRALVVASCAFFPLLGVFGVYVGGSMMAELKARNPELLGLSNVLAHRRAVRFVPSKAAPTDKEFAIYIARRYGGFITNTQNWNNPFAAVMIPAESRSFAERSIAVAHDAAPAEIESAEKNLKPLEEPLNVLGGPQRPWFAVMTFHITLLTYVAIPAVIAALAFRKGLVLLCSGIAFVRRDGSPASRLRLVWRALVAWTPCGAATVAVATGFGTHNAGLLVLGTLLLIATTVVSLLLPERGLQDRIAGTWPVIR